MAKGETGNDASGKIVILRMVIEGVEMTMIEIATGPETGNAGLIFAMTASLHGGTGRVPHEGSDRDRDLLVTGTNPGMFPLIVDRDLAHPALTDTTSGEDVIDLSSTSLIILPQSHSVFYLSVLIMYSNLSTFKPIPQTRP